MSDASNGWDVNKRLLFTKLDDVCRRLTGLEKTVGDAAGDLRVLRSKLEDLEKRLEKVEKKASKHGEDIVRLTVKASIWGAAGGGVIGLLILVAKLLGF